MASLNYNIWDALNNAYKETVPVNARYLASSVLSPSPRTEKSLSPKELEALQYAYLNSQYRVNSMKQQDMQGLLSNLNGVSPNEKVQSQFGAGFVSPQAEKMMIKQNLSPTLQYSDYPVSREYDQYGVGNMPIGASFKDKGYALSTAIGRANYYTDPQGNLHVKDRYDFPKGSQMEDYGNWSAPFKAAHAFGEKYSKPMPVDINLGLLNDILKKQYQ